MDDLTALRATLAILYPTQDDARRVVIDAGLNPAYIQFSDKAINNWHNILMEAEKRGSMAALLEIAISEYGTNPELVNAVQAYGSATDQPPTTDNRSRPTTIYQINTGGGPYVSGNINTNGGDFVGRDQKSAALDSTVTDLSAPEPPVDPPIAVADQPIHWTPLWPSPRIDDSQQIAEWVRVAQLKFNPFGPEQAEWDPELLMHYVYPPVFEECLRNARSAIIFGAPGSGKTACKLLLTHFCYTHVSRLHDANTFPVPCSFDSSSESLATVEGVQKFVVEQLARALIPFFALNPSTFLTLDDDAKLAIVACLRHTFSVIENVKIVLSLAGLRKHRLGERMLRELDQLALRLQNAFFTQRDWVEIISKARPKNFSRTFIICDLANATLTTDPTQALLIQRLIDYVVSPVAKSIYLKALLPEELQAQLSIPEHVAHCTLTWPVELLEQMLQQRVRAENEHRMHFEQLFTHEARLTNPAHRLARSARGSPRQLIRLGNYLLAAHVRRRPGEIEIDNRTLTSTLRQRKRICG